MHTRTVRAILVRQWDVEYMSITDKKKPHRQTEHGGHVAATGAKVTRSG